MRWLFAIAEFLVPSLLLSGSPWREEWNIQERRKNLQTTRVTLGLAAVLYFVHIFLDDIAQLEPRSTFVTYRVSLVAYCTVAWAIAPMLERLGSSFPRLLLAFSGMLFSTLQAVSMTWNATIPMFFCIVLAFMSSWLLRVSPLLSAAYFSAILMVQNRFSPGAQGDSSYLSLCIVAAGMLIVIRSSQGSEIASFISANERLNAERRSAELEKELSRQIRAFLPLEIFARIEAFREKRKMTVVQAIDTVLQTRITRVVCLYSDIRGFTQNSKDLGGYVREQFLPDIRECTVAVEENHGIPRIIGDLVFGYFDDADAEVNVSRCLHAAWDLLKRNDALNADKTSPVMRYCILTSGEAMVGNIGGYDSSREITAIGTPVNLAARIDTLTKDPAVKSVLGTNRIVLSQSCWQEVQKSYPQLEATRVDLKALEAGIRDFSEETSLWVLPMSSRNITALSFADPTVSNELEREAA